MSTRDDYTAAVLAAYVRTPGVLGRVRTADTVLAARLYDHGVPLYLVTNAFLLAATRRIRNNAFADPLPPIRSLHYFLPVLRELQQRPLGPRDIDRIRETLGGHL